MVMELIEQDAAVEAPALTLTPVAVNKIRELLVARNLEDYALRVFVAGGGCSGLQYGMAFEAQPEDFDTVVETDGVRLVVDPTSLLYLRGANIDYVDDLMGGGFRIDNPNAVSTCGCGHSFRTEGGSSAASGGGCSSCG